MHVPLPCVPLRRWTATFVVLFAGLDLQAAPGADVWVGGFETGPRTIPYVLRVFALEDGEGLRATLDRIDQVRPPQEVDSIDSEGGSLTLSFDGAGNQTQRRSAGG